MNWLEMNAAVEDAKETLRLADLFTRQIGTMLKGRLRSGAVDPGVLASFKRELRDFDIRSYEWKD